MLWDRHHTACSSATFSLPNHHPCFSSASSHPSCHRCQPQSWVRLLKNWMLAPKQWPLPMLTSALTNRGWLISKIFWLFIYSCVFPATFEIHSWSQLQAHTQSGSSHTHLISKWTEAECERCSKGRLGRCLRWCWGHYLEAEVLSRAKHYHSYHPGEKRCLQNSCHKRSGKNFEIPGPAWAGWSGTKGWQTDLSHSSESSLPLRKLQSENFMSHWLSLRQKGSFKKTFPFPTTPQESTCYHVSSSRFGPVHDDKGVTAFDCHDSDVVRGFQGTQIFLSEVIRDDFVEALHLEVLQSLCQGAGGCWIFIEIGHIRSWKRQGRVVFSQQFVGTTE